RPPPPPLALDPRPLALISNLKFITPKNKTGGPSRNRRPSLVSSFEFRFSSFDSPPTPLPRSALSFVPPSLSHFVPTHSHFLRLRRPLPRLLPLILRQQLLPQPNIP